MYTLSNILKHILPIIVKPISNNHLRYRSSFNEDILFDLTTDYNRKRSIHSDLLSNAIQNISEKHSLFILTAVACCIHHVTPEKRVELLQEVNEIDFSLNFILFQRSGRHEDRSCRRFF